MPGKDSSPAPRRKKLVLRKISVDGSSIPGTWSGSYTGPLPEVRPPPRPSSVDLSADLSAEAEPEAVSEMMIESTMVVTPAPKVWAPASPEAWAAAAAMTPAMPQAAQVLSVPGPEFYPEPVPVPSPSPAPVQALDTAVRASVAPVSATLPPPASALFVPGMLFGRARLSLDSKVLFAGGALATSMLLVALGVFLGVHSKGNDGAPPAFAAAYSVPEPKVAATTPPATAVEIPPAASVTKPFEAAEAPSPPSTSVALVSDLAPATVDVSQLPPAPPPRPRWTARVVPTTHQATAAVTGWTVPGAPAASVPSTETSTPDVRTAESSASSWTPTSNDVAAAPQPASSAPEPAAASSAAVDPLVQAVREDIREDEARAR